MVCASHALARASSLGLLVLFSVACASPSAEPPADASDDTHDAGTTSGHATADTHATDDTATTGDTADTSESGNSTDPPPPTTSVCDRLLELDAELADTLDVAQEAFLIQHFMDEILWGHDGFPIVEDERTCFVHLGEPGDTLTVAGDWNDWAPADVPLTQAQTGLGFYFVVVELPRADALGLYKLVRDGTEYFADPHARRFGWDENGEYSMLAPDPARSHYERWPGFSAGVGALAPRDITVYVPPDGLNGDDLALLVMHDGQNLFSPDATFGGWRVGPTIDAALAAGEVQPLIVVGVNNTPDRMDEYTHVADDLGGALVGGRAAEYAQFMVDGVLPFIEQRYPVTGEPERTAVLGSSLGGLVSLYIAWAWPDRFGHAGSMSGTLGWGSFGAGASTILDLFEDDPPSGVRIYVDSGGGEGFGCPNGDSDNYCDNLAFTEGLRALGWEDGVDLQYEWEADAPHNESAWAARLGPALRAWFP